MVASWHERRSSAAAFSSMLPLALVLALQCWLGLTERVTSERNRIMGSVACVLAICVLGVEQASSGAGELEGGGFGAEIEAAELSERPPPPPPYESHDVADDSAWWQPSAPSWSLWPVADGHVPEQGVQSEQPSAHGTAAPSSATAARPSTKPSSPTAAQPARPLTWIVHRAAMGAARLRRGALSAWYFMQRCGVPTTASWEHMALLGLGLLAYANIVFARRQAPSRLREALDQIEKLHLEIREIAEQLNHQNRNEAPSPDRLRRRRATTDEAGVRTDETTPRRMDLDRLLNAAEEPQLIWRFSSAELRGRLTDAARKYRKVDTTLKQICWQLTSFDSIGLDNWWGRTKRYEVATDCALACADARASSLTHHSVDRLQTLLMERDGGWMARIDGDGDGVLTDREIHTARAGQVRAPEYRRWQPPDPSVDGGFQHERRSIRQICRTCTAFFRRRQPVGVDGEPCQDWLLGVVWVLLVLLTPDQEFVHAENLCKRLIEQYNIQPAWFRRLVDIRREQMDSQAETHNHWTRRLSRRVGGVTYFLLGATLLIITDVVPPSSLLAAWNWFVNTAQRQILRIVVAAKLLMVLSVLLLLVEFLHWLGLFADRAPGSNWRHAKRRAFKTWWNPPRPAFRVEEEPLVEEDEIHPEMDQDGRVLYKRYSISTHPDWHRCVPADGSPTFYVRSSTGQLEWVLPTLDDDGDGGTDSPADRGSPHSAPWNMHTDLSRPGYFGGQRGAWPKWLEATEAAGADLTSAEAAQLNALPPSPAQLAEAEERARQRSLSSTGADVLPGGEPGRTRPNLVVNRLRLSNWERMRNVVAPTEGEAALSADERERQDILKLAQEARKAAELADRPPLRPSNPKWVAPSGGRSLEEEERDGLKAWRESQSRSGLAQGKRTGVGKSLDELPPPPWMMEKEEIAFRLAIERQRDELNMRLATEQVEAAKKRKEQREREARGAAGGLLSPVRALFTPSKASPQPRSHLYPDGQ